VDVAGVDVEVEVPADTDLTIRRGDIGSRLVLEDLPPGPIQLTLKDRDGREVEFRTVVKEGEDRAETVLFE
jgi:hypothetical protein